MGTANSVTVPVGLTRAIRFPTASVTHRLPSGPATMSSGSLFDDTENVVMAYRWE